MSTNLSENSVERSLRLITLFLGLIFLALVLTFCFVASSLCITIVVSVFLAILVDPIVGRLEKLHLGRPLAAGGNRRLRHPAGRIPRLWRLSQGQLFCRTAPHLLRPNLASSESHDQESWALSEERGVDHAGGWRIAEVKIKEGPNWPSFLARGVGSISSILVLAGVVPFLSFFML
jgi:predicted PurR-regulated permease PerM